LAGDKRIDHKHHACKHGDDMPDIAGWWWDKHQLSGARATSTAGEGATP
jgi:hypothetical protein